MTEQRIQRFIATGGNYSGSSYQSGYLGTRQEAEAFADRMGQSYDWHQVTEISWPVAEPPDYPYKTVDKTDLRSMNGEDKQTGGVLPEDFKLHSPNNDGIEKVVLPTGKKIGRDTDREAWLQIYCAVIAGRYHIYEGGTQDAVAVIDLTDDLFEDYKELWEKK